MVHLPYNQPRLEQGSIMSLKLRRKIRGIILILFFCLSAQRVAFAAAKPAIGTISPASGSTLPDTAITFTVTYSDADGWANLKEAYFLISTSPYGLSNMVYLYYDQNSNKLYLRNDNNTAWLGGFAPGAKSIMENAQAKINCNLVTVSGSGKTMTVKWNIAFKSNYAGKVYSSYLKVIDDTAKIADWTQKGAYCIYRQPVSAPK